MILRVRYTSSNPTKEIEVDTIDDLFQWVNEGGEKVIMNPNPKEGWDLEIYDTYRE